MRQTNAIVLTTILGAYSVLASADAVGPGPNGGQVKDAGKYHLELVVKDAALTVYVAGGKGAKVATKGASGTATVLAGKGTSNVKLPAGAGHEGRGVGHAARRAAGPGAIYAARKNKSLVQGRHKITGTQGRLDIVVPSPQPGHEDTDMKTGYKVEA